MAEPQPIDLAAFAKTLAELNEKFSKQLIAQAEESARKLYEQSDQLLADIMRKQAAGTNPPPG